ncbi:MAG TPA: BMP family ABC transporter substrate-binding protein [Candidatus Paceibacterota bacterium]|nr:BMP family ABC transporter substrate-binding protein [Candidatus Paceibacterota bacterium]
MKFRVFALSLIVFALSVTTLATTSQATHILRIGIAYEIGGPGDHAFNDAVAEGIALAKKRFQIQVAATVTTGSESDRVLRLKNLIAMGAGPVIAVGGGYAAAIKEVAQLYPNHQFAMVNDATVDLVNVASLIFAEDQGGYLAGVAAAYATKTDRIGLVGSSTQSKKYEVGFLAGARATKKGLTFGIKYSKDSWGAAAAAMVAGGADVIFLTTTGSDSDVLDAIVSANKDGANAGLIVVEPDQYVTLTSGTKKYILASVMKRVDKAIVDFISESVAGRSVADVLDPKLGIYGRKYGIQNGGIEISLWSASLAKYRKSIYLAALKAGKLSK